VDALEAMVECCLRKQRTSSFLASDRSVEGKLELSNGSTWNSVGVLRKLSGPQCRQKLQSSLRHRTNISSAAHCSVDHDGHIACPIDGSERSEEHTFELQSRE